MPKRTKRRPAVLSHEQWMAAAAEEYRCLLQLLRSLEPQDWRRSTDCTEWDVFAVVAHLCGAAQGNARLRETVRQAAVGRHRHPRPVLVDSINALQVTERASRTPAQLIAELEDAAGRGVAARRRLPGAVRSIVLPLGPPLGTKPVGYLMDCIYTRDAWMHRIDIARATDHQLLVTPEHDGRLVADVVDEWAHQHGQPFELKLTGPAGLHRTHGRGGQLLELDAIDFARILAGRAPGTGLLAVTVPF